MERCQTWNAGGARERMAASSGERQRTHRRHLAIGPNSSSSVIPIRRRRRRCRWSAILAHNTVETAPGVRPASLHEPHRMRRSPTSWQSS